jgi:hypothetical protein
LCVAHRYYCLTLFEASSYACDEVKRTALVN